MLATNYSGAHLFRLCRILVRTPSDLGEIRLGNETFMESIALVVRDR